MFKNVASQKIKIFAIIPSTGLPKTGDAANITVYVSKDNGTVTALTDTSATELDATNAKGWYVFDLAQAETNADDLLFTGKSTTSDVSIVGAQVYTTPPNFTKLGIDSSTGGALTQSRLQKNASGGLRVVYQLTDSTAHNPAPGATSKTITRSIDGGAFGAGTVGTVTEIANGWYYADFAAADINGAVISIQASASGCDVTPIVLFMEP